MIDAPATLVDRLVGDCVDREGYSDTMYLDGAGYVTVGHGHKIDSAALADALPFDRPGAGDEWKRVHRMPAARRALYYRRATSPRLVEGAAHDICRADVLGKLSGIGDVLPDVLAYPTDAVRGLVAIAFTTGSVVAWRDLCAACRRRDWTTAADEAHIKNPSDSPHTEATNQKLRAWFLAAAQVEGRV